MPGSIRYPVGKPCFPTHTIDLLAYSLPIEDTKSPDVDLSFLYHHPLQSSQKHSETKDATAESSEEGFELVAALKEFSMDNKNPVLPHKHVPLPQDDTFSGREAILSRIR